MLFSSPLFIFIFLPAALALYFLSPRAWRNTTLFVVSLVFYAWGEPAAVFIILASAILDFYLGSLVKRPGTQGAYWLALGVSANIGLLIFYKYTNFFISTIEPISGPLPHLNVILPLGISFIVFEKITYLVDIRRGVGRQAANIRDYFMFVFLFPKILAGPIVKYHEIEGYLKERTTDWDERFWGLLRFLWGLGRKILIADVCAEVVDKIFGLPAGSIGFSTAWIAIIAFTTQIYFDFAGYSDMAIGLAQVFGFKLRENFNNPYASANFSEFWRRWHISLQTWIMQYLYVPLGGNRRGHIRTYINLWICFLLSGLWHGAAWNFVLWGAWNGLFLVIDRLFWVRFSERLPRIVSVALTLPLLMVGWAIFRSHGMAQLSEVLAALANPTTPSLFVRIQAHQIAAIVIGLGGSLLVASPQLQQARMAVWASPSGRAFTAAAIILLGAIAVEKAVTVAFNPFLYFRF